MKCIYCDKPRAKPYNAKTCGGRECTLQLKRDIMRRRRDIMPREPRAAPKLKCDGCGDPMRYARINSKSGKHYCSKPKCTALGGKERRLYDKQHKPDPIFLPLVNGNNVWCGICKFTAHCSERVRVGLWVACERADDKDKERIAISPDRDRIQELLQEGLTLWPD